MTLEGFGEIKYANSRWQGTTNSPAIGLGAEAGEHDDGLSSFAGVRPRLSGSAYRMLGSASEAEDQESAELTRGNGIPPNRSLR